MQTYVPNGWDHPRLVLLTDNSMAWRFRAQLATKQFVVLDCRGAPMSAIHDELTRLQPDLIAVSLRNPQPYAPMILDYASAKERADFCLFRAGPQQWLNGLDPQLLQRLEEGEASVSSERLALKDVVALARLLFMTQRTGFIGVDFADIVTWLASGGQSARVAVKSIYIRNPPEPRDCYERLRFLRRKIADVRGACFCFEWKHAFSVSEFDQAGYAIHDSMPESELMVFGVPFQQVTKPRGSTMRLLVGLVWLPPGSSVATIDR